MSVKDTFKGATKQDIAILFTIVFLGGFATVIGYMVLTAETDIKITGTIDANYLMGIFTGIVIAMVGFLGITRGRAETSKQGPGQT